LHTFRSAYDHRVIFWGNKSHVIFKQTFLVAVDCFLQLCIYVSTEMEIAGHWRVYLLLYHLNCLILAGRKVWRYQRGS